MKRYLRILQPTKVYTRHDLTSSVIKTLEPDTIISYNREKRRDRVNWMEIYLENDRVAYIKKEYEGFYKCENVTLDDDRAEGFSITYKTEEKLPINELVFPQGALINRENIGFVEVQSIEDEKEGKKKFVRVEYDKNLIDVEPLVLTKKEQFFVTNNVYGRKHIFIEINNLKDKKGFILKKTDYTNQADKWMKPLVYTIMIVVVLGLILAGLAAGWLVISGLMIIPAIIVAFIAIFALQIVLMILKGIFNMIRKRF